MTDLRWCTGCREWLPLEHFTRSSSGELFARCRICRADEAREWRRRNAEQVELYNRRRREEYAEAHGELERTCENPECGRTFTPSRRDARTCSRECRSRFAYLRRRRAVRSR